MVKCPDACRNCKGLCCRFGKPVFTLLDLKRLQGYLRREIQVKIEGDLFVLDEGICPFLNSDGCVLPDSKKPVICLTYPFLFNEFEINPLIELDYDGCPYAEKFENLKDRVLPEFNQMKPE